MPSMVEGSTDATLHDEPQSNVQVVQDIARGNPQRLESEPGKRGIASLIMLRTRTPAMRFTIDFDCETTIEASKVENVAIDRELSSKP